MKYFTWVGFLLLLTLHYSCSTKKQCRFRTVADLDQLDAGRCLRDSKYIYMRRFSGEFDSMRKALNIPVLPKDMLAIVYTVDNQVRWAHEMPDSTFNKAYLHHKDLEWSGGVLKYDRTSYSANDSLDQFAGIEYWLDTIYGSGEYKITYYYLNKYYPGDSSKIFSSQQFDSTLHRWGLQR